MKWVSKNNRKKYSLKRLINSFGYAFRGIFTVYKTEQNIIIHTIAAIVVIVLSIYFKISSMEFCFIALAIGLVIALEMINTALEYTIDMAMPNIHPMAKMAKDASSGAVLIMAITAVVIGIIIFGPKLLVLF